MIKLYIANLGKYNEGEHVGEWVTLPISEDELNEVYVKIKLGYFDEDGDYVHGFQEGYSFYEEMAIHDTDIEIEGLDIGEYDSISDLNELAEKLENFDKHELIAFKAILSNECSKNYNELANRVKNGDYSIYYGCDNMTDVAYDLVDNTDLLHGVPDNIRNYFDYEAYGRDLGINGTFIFIGNDCVELY